MQTVVKNEYFVNKIEKSYFILVKIKDWPLLVSLIQLFLVKIHTMDISNVIVYLFSNLRTIYICLMLINDI